MTISKILMIYVSIIALVSLECQATIAEFPFNVKPGGMEQTFESNAVCLGLKYIFHRSIVAYVVLFCRMVLPASLHMRVKAVPMRLAILDLLLIPTETHFKIFFFCAKEWVMNIEFDEKTREYTCQVERPSGKSYLYFQQFTLQGVGMSIKQAGAQVK